MRLLGQLLDSGHNSGDFRSRELSQVLLREGSPLDVKGFHRVSNRRQTASAE